MNLSELISSWCLAPPDSSRCMCGHGSQNNLVLWKEQVREEQSLVQSVDWVVEGLLLPVVCGVGVLGNILSISVLASREIDLKASFVNILICLAAYDTLFELLAVLMYVLPHHSPYYEENIFPLLVPYLLPLIHISLTGSVYTTLAVATERCVTVLAPFTHIKIFYGFLYIVPIVIFSLLYNIPKFLEVQNHCDVTVLYNGSHMMHVSDRYSWSSSSMRSNPLYTTYISANGLVMGLLPMVALAVLNYLLYRAVTRARLVRARVLLNSASHPRDSTMAALLFAIVMVFFLCHTPKAAINIYEVFKEAGQPNGSFEVGEEEAMRHPWPPTLHIMTNISHLLLAVNSAINIIVYAIKDLKFRQLLARRLLVSAPLPHHLPCKLAVTVAMGAMGGHPSPNMALSNFTVCNDGDMTVMTTQQEPENYQAMGLIQTDL